MRLRAKFIVALTLGIAGAGTNGCGRQQAAAPSGGGEFAPSAKDTKSTAKVQPEVSTTMPEKIKKSDAEWRKQLSPEEYHVAREKGTERAFTGRYWNHKGDGMYRCIGCGQDLFDSKTKFDSGCGWPSFYDSLDKSKVELHEDKSFGMTRTEVTCSRCGSHLGHVFDDGPVPTGQRYCINSVSIKFEDREKPSGADEGPPASQPVKKP